MVKIQSLKTKIVMLAMACLLLTAGVVIVYSVYFLRGRAMDDAEEQLLAIARAQASNIQAEMALALDTSRTLSQVLARVKDYDNPLDLQRYESIDLLRGILLDNTRFLGIFTCWEAKAYDYLDAGFVNEEGHDASGRFAPYWRRTGLDDTKLSPLLVSPYHSINGQPGKWYESTRQSMRDQIHNPITIHNIDGDHLIAVAVAPIIPDNQFVGVVGVDIDLAFLQAMAGQLTIFDNSGKMSVVSNNGTIAAFTGEPHHIGRHVSQAYHEAKDLQQQIRSGEEIIEIREGLLYAFAPVIVGHTDRPWAVGIVVPIDKIIEGPMSLMWKQIVIFGGITVLIFIVASCGALSFTKPLSTLVEGMKNIRNGDFSQELTVRSHDEIGEVAIVFNLMRVKLEQTLRELQEHQEMLEEKVFHRTMELKEKNEALNKANEELNLAMVAIRDAQDQLLQNEKLAVVGQMSGIVAHEVLNPVAAVSIRIETNIKQAQRTLSVIKKMNNVAAAAEKDLQENIDKLDAIIPAFQQQLSLIVKIGDALQKNQEERLEDLYFLEKQLGRIVRIIDNLRQMSKTKKHIEPVNLSKLANEVLDDMGDGLRKRDIKVVRKFLPVPPILADHTELYSIVSNLIRNAMQSLEKKDKSTQRIIMVRLVHRDDDFLELVVQDNGIGIAPESRDLLFEPGFTSKGRKGTGLGLSFSRKVARSYHGDILLLDRKQEEGAVFQVLLPLSQET